MTPKQWENISEINIAKAEQQKANSVSLRALVESLLEQTFTDMQKQVQATTAAFKLSVQETKSAKSQMEDQLAKVGQMSILCIFGRERVTRRETKSVEGRCDNKCVRNLGISWLVMILSLRMDRCTIGFHWLILE